METKFREEAEQIREKNRQAISHACENMNEALKYNCSADEGINAVLKFLNEKERVDCTLPLKEQLEAIKDKPGIDTRHVELAEGWYKEAAVPMLVKGAEGDWMAVIPHSTGSCAYIRDGRKITVTGKNAGMFTNSALYFYKNMGKGKIGKSELLSFMIKCTSVRDRISVLAFSAVAVAAGMLLPWANSYIFSRVIPAGIASGTLPTAALIFSAVTVAALLRLLQSLIMTNSMLRMSAYVQSGIFSRLLSLKTDFFKNTKAGELTQLVMMFSDMAKILSVRSITACISVILSFVYLLQIYAYAPELLGWVMLVTLLLGLLITVEGRQNTKWAHGYTQSLSSMSGLVYELFSGIEQVKLNGAEARMLRRWSEKYLDAAKKEDKPFVLKYAAVFYKLIMILGTAVIYINGVSLPASGYIAFSAAYGAYIGASLSLSDIIEMLSKFSSSFELIKPVLNGECEQSDSGKERPEEIHGAITVSDLRFKYNEDSPYVLKGLSFKIRPGESIGVIGASGCGKSTLVRLLIGFEETAEGSIYIDGFDIRELDLRYLRQRIGTVLQNTGLISGDIYSNITITKPEASMEEVQRAIEMSGLCEDIAAMPMGIHTPVSQENCTLSGGQRQRILIARALISKPSILIFDEATSALDNITQAKITESIARLDCTKIIVAHRLSTIEACDRILVMDKGVIAEEGTLEELKSHDGIFARLMKRQIN
jgi:ABC-type bacteriocin/lantibiotic exporter with double-glycine peptidase domain